MQQILTTHRPSVSRLIGVLAATTLAFSLTACSGTGDGGAEGAEVTSATLQLGWIANVENVGPFMALDSGIYKDEGLDLTIEPGGPAVTVEPLVVSGKALVGLGSADIIAKAILEGAPLKIVASTLQTNPTSIMSLASAPVNTLAELTGKRLCVQNSGVEIIRTVLQSNDINLDDVEFVTADFDPSPLVTGQCDAFMSFLNNQPITLAAQGVETVTFPLAEYGYNVPANVFVVSDETLADPAKREAVIKIIRGTAQGWRAALDDPKAAAALMVDTYGKNQNLDLDQQIRGAEALHTLVETDETQQNGLLTISEETTAKVVKTLNMLGIDITADQLFDTSLLADAQPVK